MEDTKSSNKNAIDSCFQSLSMENTKLYCCLNSNDTNYKRLVIIYFSCF